MIFVCADTNAVRWAVFSWCFSFLHLETWVEFGQEKSDFTDTNCVFPWEPQVRVVCTETAGDLN